MRNKFQFLFLVCLFLCFCMQSYQRKEWASGPFPMEREVIAEASLSLDDLTFNEVWEECEKTLIDLAYSFFTTNKKQESGLIQVGRAGFAVDYYYWNIWLIEKDLKVTLTCVVSIKKHRKVKPKTYLKEGQRELDRFLAVLKKNLEKSQENSN